MNKFNIDRRKLYILPTKIGWYFVGILLALFAIAVKFDNQPAFMMLFMLIAIALVGMHYTHSNVVGINLISQPATNIFCGEKALFPITIENEASKPRHALWLTCGGFSQLSDIEASTIKNFELKQPSVSRGFLSCDDIILTSQFPIGLFFCWSKRFA